MDAIIQDSWIQSPASDEAQALEKQILNQNLTVEKSCDCFGTGRYAIDCEAMGMSKNIYATSSQLQELSALGISVRDMIIPKPAECEFCGKKLDYIALIRHNCEKDGLHEWEVKQWSEVPLRCCCEKAKEKWAEHDKQEKILHEKKKMQIEAAQKKAKIEYAFANSGMKKRFLTRTFSNFTANIPQQAYALKIAKEYADNFEHHKKSGTGLYIEGTFGTGKTHLAAAIAIQLMEQGHVVVFKTCDDMLREIKATFDSAGNEEEKIVAHLKQCELLVIDDLGKEQATDWSTALLYAIINDRYECLRPVIITTNFNENDLIAVESPKGVGTHRIKAILSRLHEMCGLMTMDWQDWRGNG